MLSFSGTARIFLCQLPIDLRRGFEGLTEQVGSLFNESVTDGAYFAFFNKRQDRMKILYWDGDGLVIWYKRLEKGRFKNSLLKDGLIERREFLMLLEGVTPRRMQNRFKIS